jgi:hypothetical protein
MTNAEKATGAVGRVAAVLRSYPGESERDRGQAHGAWPLSCRVAASYALVCWNWKFALQLWP